MVRREYGIQANAISTLARNQDGRDSREWTRTGSDSDLPEHGRINSASSRPRMLYICSFVRSTGGPSEPMSGKRTRFVRRRSGCLAAGMTDRRLIARVSHRKQLVACLNLRLHRAPAASSTSRTPAPPPAASSPTPSSKTPNRSAAAAPSPKPAAAATSLPHSVSFSPRDYRART